MNRYFYKIPFLFIILFSFFAFLINSNAKVYMCFYDGKMNTELYGEKIETRSLYITLEGNQLTISTHMPSFFSPGGIYTNFDTFYMKLSSPLTVEYHNSGSYAMIKKNFSVVWKNDTVKTNLINKGICPDSISWGGQAGQTKSLLMDLPQDDSYDSADHAGVPLYINYFLRTSKYSKNYYPVDNDGMATQSLINTTNINRINEYSTSCINNTETINYLTDFFNLNVNQYEKDISTAEKSTIAEMYKNNGLNKSAKNIVKNYNTDSKCYKNNKKLQTQYKKLTKAASSFLYRVDEVAKEDETNNCEKIIGKGTFVGYLNQTFRFIQFVGPAIVILLTTFEYIKVVATSDADLLKKTNSRTIMRICAALALFLLPILLRFILNAFGFYGDCLDTIL